MKTTYFVYIPIILLVFVILIAGFIVLQNNDAEEDNSDEVSQDQTQYEQFTSSEGNDYVYYSRSQENITDFQADCNERNGEFLECGSSCSLQGGEICPSVCDILCEL